MADARVVDQHLDGGVSRLQLLPQLASGLGLGEVKRDGTDLDAVLLAQLRGDTFQPVGGPGDQDEVGPLTGELRGERGADPHRRAGYQSRPAAHLLQGCHWRPLCLNP